MRRRLTNPKRIKINLLCLPIEEHEGGEYRVFNQTVSSVDDGSCQCYKDCDCSDRQGEVTKTETTWYRSIDFDGTDKAFYSEPYKPISINL